MDSLTLDVLCRQLRPSLLEQTILKLKMSQDPLGTLSLKLSSNLHLVVWLNPQWPLLFLSDEEVSADSKTTGGVAVFRKHLPGSKIRSLRKELTDRRIFVDVENFQQAHRPEKFTLVLELIPPRPNIVLLDSQSRILASLLREAGSSSTTYCPFLRQPAFQLGSIDSPEYEESFRNILSSKTGLSMKSIGQALGLSPSVVQEMSFGVGLEPGLCLTRLRNLFHRTLKGPYEPHLYHLGLKRPIESPSLSGIKPERPSAGSSRERWLITPFAFDSLNGYFFRSYPSVTEACKDLFMELKSKTQIQVYRTSALAPVAAALKRKARLLERLRQDLGRFQGAETWKRFADLLYTQTAPAQPGSSFLRTLDLFDPVQAEIEIPLDPRLNLIQNANRYSQLVRKANKAIPRITRRIRILEEEIANLQTRRLALEDMERSPVALSSSVEATGSVTVHEELPNRGRSPGRKVLHSGSAVSKETKVARKFVSSEGLQILVGKTSRDNDTLTLEIARSEDFWFHVADYAGSHVILRNPEKLTTPPRRSLLEAARLAAYFSQARNAPKVEVHYTQRRMVSKPKGAKPGLVRLKQYESLLVQPMLPTQQDSRSFDV